VEMKMKTMRSSILCLVVLAFAAPFLRAQDLSKYRNFSFGMNVATVLKHTDQKMSDVRVLHAHPALIQEVTWWPPNIPGTTFRSDPVEQMLFTFYNGELYKISVTYDRTATEGLNADDMMKSISAKYGQATNIALEIDSPSTERYDSKGKGVASWEDSQYSLNLVHSTYTAGFGLIIYSKRVNVAADVATAESVKLAEQDGPKREAERQKKVSDDLEALRLKNQKTFRP
jgi:hypothetical protein